MTAKLSLAALSASLIALLLYLSFGQSESPTEALGPGLLAAEPVDARSDSLPSPGEVFLTSADASRSEANPTTVPVPAKALIEEPTSADSPEMVRLKVTLKTPFGDPLPRIAVRQVSIHRPLASLPSAPSSAPSGYPSGEVSTRRIGTTSDDGVLVTDVVRTPSRLEVVDEMLSTLVPGIVAESAAEEIEAFIVAGPLRTLRGVVVEEDGTPIPGALVTLICAEDFSARFGVPVAERSHHVEELVADADGRFEFLRSVESPQSMIKGEASGFEYKLYPAPDRGDADITVTLSAAGPGESVLRGRVVCADGSSSVGARVACEGAFYSTEVQDESGEFELPLEGKETRVHALLPGLLPADHTRAPGSPWPDELVLTIGETALEIQGTVVDEAGRPLEGLHVGIVDGVAFGVVTEPGDSFSTMRRMEDLGAPSGAARDTTDSEGKFRLGGLLPRTYRLLAQEQKTLRGITSEPIEAGQTGVRLVLDRDAPGGPIAGRVVDSDGTPVPGVSLRAERAFGFEERFNQSANVVSMPTAKTDQEGRFRMAYSAYGEVELLSWGGMKYAGFRSPLAELGEPLSVEIILDRNSTFIIQWSTGAPPKGAIRMRLETPDGEPTMLGRSTERGLSKTDETFIHGPATPAHFVREGSYVVVLLGAKDEIERFPIVLQGGDLQTLSH
jgi:protocatechuate 3,4-dioxygenase beta subunit